MFTINEHAWMYIHEMYDKEKVGPILSNANKN